jgi:hypothetical protein
MSLLRAVKMRASWFGAYSHGGEVAATLKYSLLDASLYICCDWKTRERLRIRGIWGDRSARR